MIRLALLVVLAATAGAEVTAPLGRRARPGVPVLLRSETPTVVDLDGWRYRIEGYQLVMPPQLPCVVRDESGAELFRLVVPDGPVAGRAPPELPAWCRPALRLLDTAEDVPLGAPVGAVRPDLYDLVLPPSPESAARTASRWAVAGAAVAMALLLGLRRRRLLAAVAAVAIVAAAVGWVRTRADYRAVASGRVEVCFQRGERALVRTYWVYRAAGPGGVVTPPPGAMPVLRRPGEAAWWSGPGGGAALPRVGSVRVFVTEEAATRVAPPVGLAAGEAPLLLKKFWRRERPGTGSWSGVLSGEPAAPAAVPGEPPVLLRLFVAAQD